MTSPRYPLREEIKGYLTELSDEEKYGGLEYLSNEGHPLLPPRNRDTEDKLNQLTPPERDAIVRFLLSNDPNHVIYAFHYLEQFLDEVCLPQLSLSSAVLSARNIYYVSG